MEKDDDMIDAELLSWSFIKNDETTTQIGGNDLEENTAFV